LASPVTRIRVVGERATHAVLASAVLFSLLVLGCGGADLGERLSEIRTRQDAGKAAETLAELELLSREHTDSPELDYRLGLAMVAAGRPTEAVFPLHKASASDEFAVPAGILLASTLMNTDNAAEALRAAERVLERKPDNEAALLLKASAAAQVHDGALALETAEHLLSMSPDNTNYQFLRATALAELGRLDDAGTAYRTLFDAAVEGDSQARVRGCTSYARFLIEKKKDLDGGVELMKQCVERSPDDMQIVKSVAGMLTEFKRDDDLVGILEDAVERHPESRALRDALVAQLVSADRVGEARALAEKYGSEADDAKGWTQVAGMRRRTGDLTGALEAADKAIGLSGAEVEQDLLFFRAELLIELGRIEEADRQAQSLGDGLSRTILDARLAQARGDYRRALDLYAKVSIDWPQNHAVRALAAWSAYQLGDTERAKSDLLEATRQAPKETDAALWLAQIYYAEGNFRDCLGFAARHIKERGVVDPRAHLLSAEALAASNRPEGGLKVLADLAELQDGQFRVPAWIGAASIRARKDPADAAAKLDEQIASARLDLGDPANQALLDTVLGLRLQAGQSADASRRVEALLAKSPDSAHLLALRGRIALADGHSDAAAKAFGRAIALDPNEAAALSGRALLQRQQGDLAGAIESMNKAHQAAPENSDYAYIGASLLLEQGERAAARKAYEQVLREYPGQAAAANDLAFLLAQDRTDLSDAQHYAERAVRLRPSAETLDTLGFVKLQRGAAEEAVGMFEHALSRNPDYATARYHLALALIEKGEPVAARQALEQALAKPFPEQQEARKVLAKIDSGEVQQ
jgi:tetratricopeptide (TPR) repeat protein